MIHLERPALPEFIFTDKYRRHQTALLDFFKSGLNVQERFAFSDSIFRDYRQYMKKYFKKCTYCESDLSVVSVGDRENFRPKSVYWWLAYEWENQVYCCQVCNQVYKGVKFPVLNTLDGKNIQGKSSIELNGLEEPLLLNPFEDQPKEHFTYVVDAVAKTVSMLPSTKRGEVSIEFLGLNRIELCVMRYQMYQTLTLLLETAKKEDIEPQVRFQISRQLEALSDVEKPYAGMISYFIEEFRSENGWILDSAESQDERKVMSKFSKVIPEKKEHVDYIIPPSQRIVINKLVPCAIEIKNFKSIGHLFLTLRTLDENIEYAFSKFGKETNLEDTLKESWLLILGENGVGKSSILQAVVLALLPDPIRAKYIDNPKDLIKIGTKNGYVRIKLGDKKPVEMKFTASGKITSNLEQYNDYLLAYGATRLLPKGLLQPEMNPGRIKVSNLFDYSIALENAELWLISLSETNFDQAALFLKDLLFLSENLVRCGKNIFVKENDRNIDLGKLSDGYKTLLALAVDILKTFVTNEVDVRYNDVQQYATGLILIDEIGTHLHPRWKMTIVERLRTALPKVFFIVTTHEPLCMRGLRDKEVVVLAKDADTGHVSNITDLPSPEGLRVDQLLTSRYFGLNSTIDPIVEENFKKYYNLLSKPEAERSSVDIKEIEDLQFGLRKFNQLGENLREELFFYVIDETIAANLRQPGGLKTKTELKTEVKSKIEGLLKKIDISTL